MNSTTGDFSEIKRSFLRDEVYSRTAHSSVKRNPRKLINLRPLNINCIKKEIEEGFEREKQTTPVKIIDENNEEITKNAEEDDVKLQKIPEYDVLRDVTNSRTESIVHNGTDNVIEKPKDIISHNSKTRHLSGVNDRCISQEQKNDSFDLDFSALALSTPVKQTDSHVTSSLSCIKANPTKEQFQQFVTPKVNNIFSKNSYSLSKKSALKTPLNSINSSSTRKLVPYKPMLPLEISSELPEKYAPSNEDKGSNTFPNYIKDRITTPSHKIPMKFIQDEHTFEKNDSLSVNTLKDDTFQRIKVNDVEYIMLTLLGKGGSSEVYQCYNPENKVQVAIKCVSLQNSASASSYINEVKLLHRLQSCSKIIKMYDYEIIESEKKLLVVLENGGQDLCKILKHLAVQKSHIPMYMLLFYWMEMLNAVKQIHSNGIIHSDLKPANFLKVDEGLKLIDFGIASSVQTDMTSVIKTTQEGSCNYISPEALISDSTNFGSVNTEKYKIHYKSDVWSLGCILYQFVYRKTPFQHITQLWPKLAAIMNPEHQIDYPAAEWVSPKIIATMKKCLQYNVKSRPSVDELITEYDAILLNI